MEFSTTELATLLGGTLEGNPNIQVTKLARIEDAERGCLTFLNNPKYYPHFYTTKASAVLVDKNFSTQHPTSENLPALIRLENPYAAFIQLMRAYYTPAQPDFGIESFAYIAPTASLGINVYVGAFSYISPGAKVGENVYIYPNVFIGENVTIDDHTIIYPNVTIYRDCVVGKHCILHAGCVIGADGFGFLPGANGQYEKIPQVGAVTLEDYVEIGANTCIDRAVLGQTRIAQGAKLDNLIQVAHNVEIGRGTVIAAQTGISGSSRVGKYCRIGGQVGLAGHIEIADQVGIGAQSGLGRSIKETGAQVHGSPAQPLKQQLRMEVLQRKLPELLQRIELLESRLSQLENSQLENLQSVDTV